MLSNRLGEEDSSINPKEELYDIIEEDLNTTNQTSFLMDSAESKRKSSKVMENI